MTIVVGTDFSPESEAVASVAADIAQARTELLLIIHVVDGPVMPSHHDRLAELEGRMRARGARVTGIVDPRTPAGRRVAELAEFAAASLLVVGAHGQSASSHLDDATVSMLRSADVPLLIVRAPERLASLLAGKGTSALLCIGLDDTDDALHQALALLASLSPVDAHVAHYRLLPESQAQRNDAVRLAQRDLHESMSTASLPPGVRAASSIVRDGMGRLDVHLAELATERDVDIVVVGSHRRTGLARLRDGSIAEGVIKHARVNVLVAGASPR